MAALAKAFPKTPREALEHVGPADFDAATLAAYWQARTLDLAAEAVGAGWEPPETWAPVTHVWGVRRDSLDIPYVVGRKLVRRK